MQSPKKRQNEINVKCIVIGDTSTGKTSIVRRYIDNQFETNYCTTIGVDFKQKSLLVGTNLVKLQLWDTAGQEKFRVMAKSYYKGSQACLIIYDVTRKDSYSNVKSWCDQYIDSVTEEKPCVIIVGNKSDLKDQRAITTEEGKALAEKLSCKFCECSAKEGGDSFNQMFDSLFEDCINKAIEQKEQAKRETFKLSHNTPPPKKGGCCN